jgi:selenocysteine-specific elongation factor
VDEELMEMAKYEILEFLENTSLKDVSVVGVSSVTGQGKEELIKAIEKTVGEITASEKGHLFRMYVDRIFSVKGFGSVVTGSVMGGKIETGNEVFLLPGNNQKLRVRTIERHGTPVTSAVAGDRAAINLIGIKNEDFKRGMIISDKNLKETQMVDASVKLFEKDISLSLWSTVNFLSGTFECLAKMHAINKDIVNPEEDVIVQIHLSKPAILLNKDKFIIRNSSGDKTLGGGYIIDASPLHHKKRTLKLIENLSELSETIMNDDNTHDIIKIELKKEFRPFSLDEVAERLNIKVARLREDIEKEVKGFLVYRASDSEILIDKNYDEAYKIKVIKILEDYHREFPLLADGYEANEIVGKMGFSKMKTGKSYLNMILQEIESTGQIEKYKNTWIIKGHKPLLDAKTKEELDWLEKEILNYGIVKPVLMEIEEKAIALKIQKNKLKMYLTNLSREGKIMFWQNEFIHTDIVNKYRTILLQELIKKEGSIDINEFKTNINATKRFVAVLVGMYETEKIITMQGLDIAQKIVITELGRSLLKK